MCDLLARVAGYVQQRGLLSVGATTAAPAAAVVVGVSGGPDSVCLLHLLTRLAASPVAPGLRLHVAHLNHQLRGAEADADAQFVADLAAAWGLPCTVGRADVAALAGQPGLSLEEAARQARYAFLAEVARAAGADTIAVGHNADDQAETVLMHFLRGSGVAGLRGMLPATELAEYRLYLPEHPERSGAESKDVPHPSTGGISSSVLSRPPAQDALQWAVEPPERSAPESKHPERSSASLGAAESKDAAGKAVPLRLIRPLLGIPRADILAYCAAQGLTYRLDRSNEDTTLYRNRLRHELLPLLESYNPGIRAVLTHTAEVMAGDYEVLAAELGRAWAEIVLPARPDEVQLDLSRWRVLSIGLQRAVVRKAVHRLRRSLRNVNWQHVERAVRLGREGQPGQAATLVAGLALQVSADRLRIADEGTPWPVETDVSQIADVYALAAPGVTALPCGWQVAVSRLNAASLPSDYAGNTNPWRAWLDAEIVGAALTLRPRVPGDRMEPQGMGGHMVRLNELMINLKVPRAARAGWPILVGQAGIAWACGLRLDERAAVRPTTVEVWQVEFTRTDS